MKFYAVKNGRVPGIYTTWEDCKRQVDGFSGAVYKSFASREQARDFITGECGQYSLFDVPTAYVDGSYNPETREFSFGAVLLMGGEEKTFSQKFKDEDLASMRNVAGEIKGAEFILKYCMEKGIDRVNICYDYEGISAWATGRWKTNKDGTRKYRELAEEILKKVSVNFVKVKGHSGDKYNDMADKLAKSALGLE